MLKVIAYEIEGKKKKLMKSKHLWCVDQPALCIHRWNESLTLAGDKCYAVNKVELAAKLQCVCTTYTISSALDNFVQVAVEYIELFPRLSINAIQLLPIHF